MRKRYKEGEFSLYRLSQGLDRPVSRVIDLLAELEVQSPLEKGDPLGVYKKLKSRY